MNSSKRRCCLLQLTLIFLHHPEINALRLAQEVRSREIENLREHLQTASREHEKELTGLQTQLDDCKTRLACAERLNEGLKLESAEMETTIRELVQAKQELELHLADSLTSKGGSQLYSLISLVSMSRMGCR